MNQFLSAKLTLAMVMLLVAVSPANANANERSASLIDLLTGGAGAKQQPTSARESGEAGNDEEVKKITQTSSYASVVLDRNCPNIVQPFELKSNAALLLGFGRDQVLDTGKQIVDGLLSSLISGQIPASINLDTMEEIPHALKLAAKQLNWLPMEAEVMYGEKSHQEETDILEREHKLGKRHYPVADKMLAEILSKVSQKHEYEFKLFILKNSGGNAIARPGGFLYIDQGLIENSARHPKAYFALAHEVAHVLQRHETKDLQSMVIDSISAKKDLVNVIATAGSNPAIVMEHVKVGKNLFTRHHIDQELQSDACAVKLLDRVFSDDQKLENSIQIFVKDLPAPEGEKIASAPQSDVDRMAASVHEIVNTPMKRHPNTTERTTNLDAIQKEIKARRASGK